MPYPAHRESPSTQDGMARRLIARVGRWVGGYRHFFIAVGIVGGLFVAFCSVASLWSWWNNPIRQLGSAATNAHEYRSPFDNYRGDYTYCYRADCSEADFHRVARRQGMQRHDFEEPPAYPALGWPLIQVSWWDPPQSYRGVYYSATPSGECYMLAYSDGHIYFAAQVW